MVARFFAEFESSVSTARLRRYRPDGASDLDTLVNYTWNLALAEALVVPLNAAEIALRNALHSALTSHFGTPVWYELHGLLEPNQARDIERVKRRIMDYGNLVTPDRVVSELTMGFWVTILSRPYDARLWRGQRAASLKQAFPRIPRSLRQRAVVHEHFNEIRELRNRAFHHEPLFDDARLPARHQAISQGLGWIAPSTADWIRLFDRVPDVWTNGRARAELRLKDFLGVA